MVWVKLSDRHYRLDTDSSVPMARIVRYEAATRHQNHWKVEILEGSSWFLPPDWPLETIMQTVQKRLIQTLNDLSKSIRYEVASIID